MAAIILYGAFNKLCFQDYDVSLELLVRFIFYLRFGYVQYFFAVRLQSVDLRINFCILCET